jgi:predicted nuclease of predicted toxin-antitoxin system
MRRSWPTKKNSLHLPPMQIKLDENLPAELVDDLTALGHDVDSVESEGLAGQPDLIVAAAGHRSQRVLFTLDKGLGDVRRFAAL